MIIQKVSNSTAPTTTATPGASVVPHTQQSSTPAVSIPAAKEPLNVPAEKVHKVVSELNHALNLSGSKLQFTIDRETETAVVTMVDSETGDVIRQIPSEEAIAIARSIDSMLERLCGSNSSGLLYSETV